MRRLRRTDATLPPRARNDAAEVGSHLSALRPRGTRGGRGGFDARGFSAFPRLTYARARGRRGAGIPAVAIFPSIEAALKDGTGTHGAFEEQLALPCRRRGEKRGAATRDHHRRRPRSLHQPRARRRARFCGAGCQRRDRRDSLRTRHPRSRGGCGHRRAIGHDGRAWSAPSVPLWMRRGTRTRSFFPTPRSTRPHFYGPCSATRLAARSARTPSARPVTRWTLQMSAKPCVKSRWMRPRCADIVMVKPAGPYLDIISEVRRATSLPLAAYQVSAGEYAQPMPPRG